VVSSINLIKKRKEDVNSLDILRNVSYIQKREWNRFIRKKKSNQPQALQEVTLNLLEPEVNSLCHHYAVRTVCISVQSDILVTPKLIMQ
jgi:hypothetical protein